jgi:hypothetical protein
MEIRKWVNDAVLGAVLTTVIPGSVCSQEKATGASVINCWWTSCNSFAWYSLRLNLRPPVPSSRKSTNHEESQLSKSRLHSTQRTSRQSYYSLWWCFRNRLLVARMYLTCVV